jgi:RNA polymerase sigma factor (sigma-70 family)
MTTAAETSWTMVRGAAAGDGSACRRFADAYLAVVRGFLARRWQGTPAIHGIDDAVQEVFLDLFRSGGALARLDRERTPCFRGVLYGVARNVALRHEESVRSRRCSPGALDLDSLPADERSMSRQFDGEWARRMVRRAADRQRAWAAGKDDGAVRRVELLDLRFGEGLPIRAIAARWGEEPAAVHREYAKARAEFAAALRAEVALYTGGNAGEVERECRLLLDLLG